MNSGVEETVECSECGNRYDSASQPFCPRCGSQPRARAAKVTPPVVAADARARRARAGGIILLILGGLALLQSGWTLVAPPAPDAEQLALLSDIDFLREQPGGDALVMVVDNGTAVEADVALYLMNGTLVENGTAAQGRVDFGGLPSPFVNITVTWQAQQWFRHVYAPAGESVEVAVDVAQDRPGAVEWDAVDQVGATRILAAFLVLFSAFVVLGGALAVRLQKWGIALAAAILAAVPALVLTVVAPLAGLLLLAPSGLALAFIAMGRHGFR